MEIVLRMFTYGLLILIIFISLVKNEKKRAGYYYDSEDKGKKPLVGCTPSDPEDLKDSGLAYEEPKKGYRLISIILFILLTVVLVIFLLDFFYFNMKY